MHRLLSMLDKLRFSGIQIGLVLFWAIWLTVVTVTNIFDAMKQLGALPAGFTLVSYNFELVKKTLGAHGVPTLIAAWLIFPPGPRDTAPNRRKPNAFARNFIALTTSS